MARLRVVMSRVVDVVVVVVVLVVVVDGVVVVVKLGAKAAVEAAKEKITISTKSSNKACFFMV